MEAVGVVLLYCFDRRWRGWKRCRDGRVECCSCRSKLGGVDRGESRVQMEVQMMEYLSWGGSRQ